MAIRIRKGLHELDVKFEYEDAIASNDVRRLKTLIRHKLPPHKNCLYQAVMCDHKNLIPILLDAGADPNEFVNRSWTLMGDCILDSDIRTLKLILSHGANPNLSYRGLPSALLASRVGNLEVLRVLIKAGASLFNDPGIAPNALFEAVGRGHKEIVKFLIQGGIKFTTRKPFGMTAIEFAEKHGKTEIRDLLLAYKKLKKKAGPRLKTRLKPR